MSPPLLSPCEVEGVLLLLLSLSVDGVLPLLLSLSVEGVLLLLLSLSVEGVFPSLSAVFPFLPVPSVFVEHVVYSFVEPAPPAPFPY